MNYIFYFLKQIFFSNHLNQVFALFSTVCKNIQKMDAENSNNLMIDAKGHYGFGALARSGGAYIHNGNKARINMMIVETKDTPKILKLKVETKRAKFIRLISYLDGNIVNIKVKGVCIFFFFFFFFVFVFRLVFV